MLKFSFTGHHSKYLNNGLQGPFLNKMFAQLCILGRFFIRRNFNNFKLKSQKYKN